MSQEVQGMLIHLEATTAQLRQEMARADATVAQVSGRIDTQLGRIDSAFDQVGRSAHALGDALKGALAFTVSRAGITALLDHAEAYTTVANRLKLVTTGAAEFTAAQNAVFDIAQRSGQPLTATAELYQRIATNQKELKLSGQGVAGIVETIAKTMVISGSSTESANAALIQLGQAFASGVLRGEELNSVMEQAPALAQAIAKGMGVSVGALRALGAAGQLTADSVVKALQAQAAAVNEQFGKMQNTVSQGMTKLNNSATNLIGKFDQATNTTSKLSGVLTSMAKSLDSVTADGNSFSVTVERVTNVVETLALIVGGRLAVAVGQSAISFVAATKASIEHTAAVMRSIPAANAATVAAAASASQAAATAITRQAEAKSVLDLAAADLAAAEQKVASDRVRQASEVGNLKFTQASLTAERELEMQRHSAQITDVGRMQSMTRIGELRVAETAMINQVRTAEVSLAATIFGTSAEIEAAYKVREAAAIKYEQTTVAANEAIALSDRATAAATATSRSMATIGTAGGALLGLMTGPVGLIATVGLLALSFIDFGGSADKASKALLDHGLTIDQTTQKYKELSAEQQRLQSTMLVKDQKEALKSAAGDLADYSTVAMTSLNMVNKSSEEYQQQFVRMIAEVKAGTRTLDSVTSWAKESAKIAPVQVARLEEIAGAYSLNSQRGADLTKKLSAIDAATTSAAASTDKLSAAQQVSSGRAATSANDWAKYIEGLKESRDLFGANAAAIAAYKADQMGLTSEQREQAKVISQQKDVLDKYKDAVKENDKVAKASLEKQLIALYTIENAAKDAAAATKKAHEDAANAAQDSATKQIAAMNSVINAAANIGKDQSFLTGKNPLLIKQDAAGRSMVPIGAPTPAVGVDPNIDPVARAKKATTQIEESTTPNKEKKSDEEKLIEKQRKALEEYTKTATIALRATQDLAAAYLGGSDSVREITIKQEIENEVLKTGEQSRKKVTAAINAQHDAQDRLDVSKKVAELRTEVEWIQKQAKATLEGQSAIDAFNVAKSVQTELIGKKIAVGSEEYEALVKQTKAQLEANKALEAANKANDLVDRLNPQVKLLKDYTDDQKALNAAMELYPKKADTYRDALVKLGNEYEVNRSKATIWGQLTEGAIDRIDQAFASAWANIGSGAGTLWDDLKKGFKQTLGEIAHMLTTKPLLNSISNWLTGTDNGQGLSSVWGKLVGSAGGSGGVAGASSGITSMISNVRSVISVAGTDFGKAIMSGWNGGDGIINGISGAFSNGADYVGSTISSAFTAGSSAAASAASNYAASVAAGASVEGYTGAAYTSYVSSANAAASLQTLSSVLGYIQGVYSIFQSFQQYGLKGAAVTGGAAAAGAAIGTYIFPVVGTAIGFAIGAVAGAFGADKLFGTGEKYPDMSTSATGNYVNGKYTDTGFQPGWQTKAPKYGAAADAQMSSIVQQFSTTLGMLYDTIGNGADVVAYNLLQVRKTSGKYSTTMGVQLDDGSVLEDHQQFNAADAAAALTENYDNVMGTFLAKAIVSSKSLPEYFKAQFTTFANDWDATADEVIAAIESVFTRFNGVNDALTRISVNNLKLDETGMIASDSILNLVASMSDLDVKTATAKEKVDALNTLVNGYYSVFYTADEQFADLTKTLKNSFAGFGLELPDTRTAYRAMVEDIDVTTAAGQAMFATMMGLATAADSYYTEIDKRAQEAAQAAQEAAQASADAWANFYNLFAVDAQKENDTLASVSAQFKALGLVLPASRDGFAEMVSSIDRTTAAGRSLFESLLGLATSADAAFTIIEDRAAESAQSLSDALGLGVTNSFSALRRAISAQQKAATDAYNATTASLNDMADTASSSISDLTSIGNDLSSALKSLRGDSDDAVKMLQAQARATLQNALATAKAGGSLSGITGLDDALDTVGSNNTDLYSSMEDFARDQGRTANVIAELEGINGKQLTSAEATLKNLQDQLDLAESAYDAQMSQFDEQLAFAQAQMDALNGVDTSVMGVTAAVNAMNAAVVAALAALASGRAAANTPQNNATLVDTLYQSVLGRGAGDTTDAAGKAQWAAALQNGSLSYADAAAAIAKAALDFNSIGYTGDVSQGTIDSSKDAAQAYLDSLKVPGFASGGDFGGGLRLVGENGPELEVTGPSRIFNANQTASMLKGGGNDSATVAELRGLREEMQSNFEYIGRHIKATADNTGEMNESGVQVVGTVETKAVA